MISKSVFTLFCVFQMGLFTACGSSTSSQATTPPSLPESPTVIPQSLDVTPKITTALSQRASADLHGIFSNLSHLYLALQPSSDQHLSLPSSCQVSNPPSPLIAKSQTYSAGISGGACPLSFQEQVTDQYLYKTWPQVPNVQDETDALGLTDSSLVQQFHAKGWQIRRLVQFTSHGKDANTQENYSRLSGHFEIQLDDGTQLSGDFTDEELTQANRDSTGKWQEQALQHSFRAAFQFENQQVEFLDADGHGNILNPAINGAFDHDDDGTKEFQATGFEALLRAPPR